MPNYDYRCQRCGWTQEEYHSMSEDPLITCAVCGKVGMVRKPSLSANFIPPCDSGWEGENKGRGRYIGGIGRRQDPQSYCRSRSEAIEKVKRQGKCYELG